MPWDVALNPLRAVMADLFPTRADAEVLLDEAGIPKHRIAFREAAEPMWHAVLTEVQKLQRLPDLLRAARERYPLHDGLGRAAAVSGIGVERKGTTPTVDLAVVVAMGEELEPVLRLLGGPDRWAREATGGFVRYRAVWACDGGPVTVLAGQLHRYGGDPTAAEVGRLIPFRPRVMAMVGVCAGRVGNDIRLGHILVADRAFNPDEGKVTAGEFRPDTTTYMPPAWLAQQLQNHAREDATWRAAVRVPHPTGDTPEAHVVPFASAAAVLAVEEPFARAAGQLRKTGGYDLEVKSFLAAAHESGVPAFAVKGVCDAGTPDKDDAYHAYAAEAAACWLYSFVRSNARYWPARVGG